MSVISCQSCGSVVDDAWSVCPQCGADPRMGAVETPSDETPTAGTPTAEPPIEAEPAASEIGGLSAEPSPDATSPDLHRRRKRQRPRPKKGLGWLVTVLMIAAGIVVGMYTEKDKADEYNHLVDQITVIDERVWTTPGKIDRLLADDILAPLITRSGAEVSVHDPGFSGAAHLLPVVREAQAINAANCRDLATLEALWDKMARLESGEERDEYARQQKRLAVLDRQIGDLTVKYFGTLAEACEHVPLSRAEEEQFGQEASRILARMEPLQSRYQELSKASEQYSASTSDHSLTTVTLGGDAQARPRPPWTAILPLER